MGWRAVTRLTLVFVLASCSGEAREPVDGALPPNDYEALEAIFARDVAPLGVRLTRGRLLDVSDPSRYRPSDTGTLLALYVEPAEETQYSTADYVNGIVPIARVFVPEVFRRWPGLPAVDICQEPPPSVDDRPDPQAVTLVRITRELALALDWDQMDLPALISVLRGTELGSFGMGVSPAVARHPMFREAVREAQTRVGFGQIPPPSP